MTVHRFFVPDFDRQQGEGALSDDQSRQVSRVLRLRAGDSICVFDGSGSEFDATLIDEGRRTWHFELGPERRPEREPVLQLTVGLAIIRNERFDLAVQKLTELGVSAIVPVAAERCVISYGDARNWEKRRARLQRIVVEAAEQSERTTLPTIHAPQSVNEFLRHSTGMDTLALVERRTHNHISHFTPPGDRLSLLVGPEGGWTPDELAIVERQARGVSLGALILRSETAAIAGASYLLLAAGRSAGDAGD